MKRILITGANRGLGLELARHYLQLGAEHVFATARTPEKADELHMMGQDFPARLTVLPLEVTNAEHISAAAEAVSAAVDGLDVLINNAAINPPRPEQSLQNITAALLRETLDINVVAPLMIVQAFLPLLRQGNAPRIANISSQMGSFALSNPGSYAYRSSKAALNMLSHVLANDVREVITVTMHPGWVQTDMGGSGASLTAPEAAAAVIQVIERLTPADSGKFLKWNGEIHPW
ncbi:MAG: SDR family oxidoreductase [Anaerolineae bacterium]